MQQLRLTPQAQKNLSLVAKPLQPTTYWRKIDVPGTIVDRPGVSDRGVVAPVTGIVTRIHAYPGDTVEPNSPLFTIRLVSESLHASQLELFKAAREIEVAKNQLARLEDVTQAGAVARSRTFEIENKIRLLEATVQSYQQDLKARGLSADSIADAARGSFAAEFTVSAPGEQAVRFASLNPEDAGAEPRRIPFAFEVHELKVELGQQVQAGQLLCGLADHRTLLIEGRGFKDDMPFIQEAARNGWDVEVEFDQPSQGNWPEAPHTLQINHVANTIDKESRTFAFFLVLENAWQAYERNGRTRLLWRFRPGDRVRLRAAVGKLDNVFVVPKEAVVREGPEAYVFQQNGDLFDRKPVHVVHEDRMHVVLANDGSVRPGLYVAQNAAPSLNRVLKAQAASGAPSKLHVHADGTVHGDH
jgi:biotin carboxyl carrier protein